jgi:GDPmannose 4,6-dehydratase
MIGTRPATAIVTGAGGQDGYFLTARLLTEQSTVHAVLRPGADAAELRALPGRGRLVVHELDLEDGAGLRLLIGSVGPDELYNLAGVSSVRRSFEDPAAAWRANAEAVQAILEAVRMKSPHTRLYQASSTDMFGATPGAAVVHDERSPLRPQSPYAAAKAAAHVMCGAYRRAFALRVACGILSNHESRRRPGGFLTRQVVDHVREVRRCVSTGTPPEPMRIGNLASQRDWGFAPDYVDGIVRIIRQVSVRAEVAKTSPAPDTADLYRDYVLGTGQLHAVWQLVDRAFALGGVPLRWDRSSSDPSSWSARLAESGQPAVVVDPARLRPADPSAVGTDPTDAFRELGWRPRIGLNGFLTDMLDADLA